MRRSVVGCRDHAIIMVLVLLLALAAPPLAAISTGSVVGAGGSGGAACVGTPPVFLQWLAWAEGTVVTNGTVTKSNTTLALDAAVALPRVSGTITSVQVTDPNSVVTSLPYNYPDLATVGLAAVGEYFKNTGSTTIPTGTYQFQATDVNGCTTTVSSTQAAYPVLGQVSITSPAVEEFLDTTTPTFTWNAVTNAQSYRVRILEAGTFATSGQTIFASPKMTSTSYTLPAGILSRGRRYALRLEAYDTSPTSTGQFFNARSMGIQDFSVLGPTAAVSSNKGIYSQSTDTLTLNIRLRNYATAAVKGHLLLWITPPGAPTAVVLVDADLQLPASLDTGGILLSAPASGFPTGNWAIGVRFSEDGDVGAERIIGFTINP